MKNILITGGSGMVGQAITKLLESKGYQVAHLSRSKSQKQRSFIWDIPKKHIDPEALSWADAIINLAGANVAQRWTEKAKKDIYDSRIDGTNLLQQCIKEQNAKLEYFISASAIGFYNQDQNVLAKEDDTAAPTFLGKVVQDWEKATFANPTIKTAAIRIGIVLSTEGGALPQLTLPVKYWIGADLGTGKQNLPWIHITDLANLFLLCLEQKLEGVYNGVVNNETNHGFNQTLAKVLSTKIWLPSAPTFMLKLVLGEMSVMVLKGCPVSIEKTLNTGFQPQFKQLENALTDLLK
jgi:uncharacterized protein